MRTEVVGESTLTLISHPTTLPGTHKWIVPCMDPNVFSKITLATTSLSTSGIRTAKGSLLQMHRVDVLDDIRPFLCPIRTPLYRTREPSSVLGLAMTY